MKTSLAKLLAQLALLSFALILAGPPQHSLAQENIDPAPQSLVEPATATPYVAGELLVRFRSAVPPGRAADVLAEQQAQAVRRVPAFGVLVVRLPEDESVEQAVGGSSIFPGRLCGAELHIGRGGPSGDDRPRNQALQTLAARSLTTTGESQTIAIVDTNRLCLRAGAQHLGQSGEIANDGQITTATESR
jgi:hypothetical protein